MNPLYKGVIEYNNIDSVAEDVHYEERVMNGSYDIVLHEPPEWRSIERILYAADNSSVENYYCLVDVPNLYYTSYGGRHHTTLRFTSRELCRRFFKDATSYYYSAFDEVCRMDVFAANNVVRLVIGRNGLDLGKECLYGGFFIPYYVKSIGNITARDVWNLSLLTIVFAIFFLYRRASEEGKISVYFMLLFLVLLLLLFYSYEKQGAYGGWYNKDAVVVENSIPNMHNIREAQTLHSASAVNQTSQDYVR
jgi:hypothetical protein